MAEQNQDAQSPSLQEEMAGERRLNLRLREVFEAAFVLVEPFFDPRNSWGGRSLEHFAFRVLRENYPDLSGEEVFIFITAARRVYATRSGRADAAAP